MESVKGLVSEDVCNQILEAIWSYSAATAETATLYGMNVANTLHEVAANPIIYSQHVVDRMAKRGNAA